MIHKLVFGNRELVVDSPKIMGILNVTPDSFSDGGLYFFPDTAIAHAMQMVSDGADIIDVGGESTRPGSQPISLSEELRRVIPVVEKLVKSIHIPISIDTTKPEVADACLQRGAHMLNDITGLRDPRMRKVAAKYNMPVVIMHMQGTPATMQDNPRYNTDVVEEIMSYLSTQRRRARLQGIEQIIIDPGIGFGKTTEHNLLILHHVAKFKELGCPIMVGPSRKGFIGAVTGRPLDERLPGTLAAVTACVLNGADIIRVHDVKECKDAIMVAQAIKTGRFESD